MEELQISQELEEKIQQAETAEEVIQACAEAGIQVTKEQLEGNALPEAESELSEDMLDTISGGGIFSRIISYYRAKKYNGGGGGFSCGGGGGGAFGGGGGGGRIR